MTKASSILKFIGEKFGANPETLPTTNKTLVGGLTEVANKATTNTADLALLKTRVDEIVAPTGEAPNPAEVVDARIGADGVTYNNLGTANRTQFSDVKSTKADKRKINDFALGTPIIGKFQSGVIATSTQCVCFDTLQVLTKTLHIEVKSGYKAHWFKFTKAGAYTGVHQALTEDATITDNTYAYKFEFGYADDRLLSASEQANPTAFIDNHFEVYYTYESVVYTDDLVEYVDSYAPLTKYDNVELGTLVLGKFQSGVIATSTQCACDDTLHSLANGFHIEVESGYKARIFLFYNSTYTGVNTPYTTNTDVPPTSDRNFKIEFGYANDSLLSADDQADLEKFVNDHFKIYYSSKNVVYSDEIANDEFIVPTYWAPTLESKASSIMALQDNGFDAFSFAFISDMHWSNNSKVSPALINELRKTCNIQILVNGGDLTGGSAVEKSVIKAELLEVCETLNKIPMTRLTCIGNHDDNSISALFAKTLNNNEKYNYIERYTEDYIGNINYGETGTYYYLDDIAHKVRYIVTDCYNLIYQDDGNGGLVYSSMTSGGLGVYRQAQINWFANEALNVPSDEWSVIVFSHNPPNQGIIINDYLMMEVLKAFNNKSDWSGASLPAVTDPNYICSITVDYRSKGGTVIGWFAGHQHTDKFVTSTYPYPIIVTTCDTMQSGMTAGTTTEQAFDIVTVNTNTKAINLTRIGAGSDRNITY